MEPGPPEPKSSRPSFLALASRSARLFSPVAGLAMITSGAVPSDAMCVNAPTGSYGCFSSANGPSAMGVVLDSISV